MASLNSLFLSLSVFFVLAAPCTAKFDPVYAGTASDGVRACIANSSFTIQNITLRENCRDAFQCVMDNIPGDAQSILSSGSAILGFIPTVLLVLGSTNAEIIRVHARYPLLAFFLSLTNMNKRPDVVQPTHPTTRPTPDSISLGPYGMVRRRNRKLRTPPYRIMTIHFLAAVGAAIVIWQTVEIGRYGVLSWACWTDFYPLIWIGMAVLQHVLSVVLMRSSLCLMVDTVLPPQVPRKSSQPTKQRVPAKSAFTSFDLTEADLQVEVGRKRFAKWGKAAADLVNNVNYLYGTAVFASITLVSGRLAIHRLATFGIITAAARMATVFVLEDIDGEE
ncbi:hypothetical protein CC86DRAFT_366792 [Ophiobolus disseminans]|uniref:Extracellular membrane protein CFEM domain-containing protein n=1 Tax=Ophiobolus disseminans TaxID=1469910 RepID=A0A6A7ADP3_9PLEO|nr:hypothetical protein CC86DRAFT_366792 [Ophiobolus disseminans]